MLPYVLICVALIIGGLVVVVLSKNAPGIMLQKVTFWVGVVLLVLGLLLVIAPVAVFLRDVVWQMLNSR